MNNLGNKKTMAENIKYYMSLNNKTRNEVCDALGFRYSTFSEWLNARKYPRIDKIELLANYFGISKSDLVEKRDTTPKTKGVKIPVLGKVAAGVPIEAIEDIIDYEEISESMSRSADYFGLQIRGNSMEPKISEGDVVIVRKQDDAESGNIVIATVNGDEATCKKIKKTESGLMLISTNPDYEPFIYSWEDVERLPVRILGRVVELRAKF